MALGLEPLNWNPALAQSARRWADHLASTGRFEHAPENHYAPQGENLWAGSNAGREVGYNGVTVWNPQGKLIGRIRLPEVCANITFGGPKRNRLFMAASQSLYAVYVNTQGAGPS